MDQEAYFGLAEGEKPAPADRDRAAKLVRVARDVQDVASIQERSGIEVRPVAVIQHVVSILGAMDAESLEMARFIMDRAMKRFRGELPGIDAVYSAVDIEDSAAFYGAVFKGE